MTHSPDVYILLMILCSQVCLVILCVYVLKAIWAAIRSVYDWLLDLYWSKKKKPPVRTKTIHELYCISLGTFYAEKIKKTSYRSWAEYEESVLLRTVFIEHGVFRTKITEAPSGLIVSTSYFPRRHDPSFHVTQDPTLKGLKTGDEEFDRYFCVHTTSKMPSAPIRAALLACVHTKGHKSTTLKHGEISSQIHASLFFPLEKLLRSHRGYFEAHRSSPEFYDAEQDLIQSEERFHA